MTAERIRTKSEVCTAVISRKEGSSLTTTSSSYERCAEYFYEKRDPNFRVYGFNQCTHYKMPSSGQSNHWVAPNGDYVYIDGRFAFDVDWLKSVVTEGLLRWGKTNLLNWNKLPSSSQFNIIMILAEFEESVESLLKFFTRPRELVPGDISYGIGPILSDIKSALSAIIKLATTDWRYEDSRGVSAQWSVVGTEYTYTYRLDGKYKLTGKLEKPDVPLNLLLDWVGFHPDFATAWDLVPLSFLVNYVLPVGQFLQSFRQGGWVKAAYFSGSQSFKGTAEVTITHNPAAFYPAVLTSFNYKAKADIYTRNSFSGVLDQPIWHYDYHETDLLKAAQAWGTFATRSGPVRSRLRKRRGL